MKKIVFAAILSIALGGTANAQNVNIPDMMFKIMLLANNDINTNGDNEIQVSEAIAVTGLLNLNNGNITDLTGIEAFTSVTNLFCNDNQLTSIDVSQNTALTQFECKNNSLVGLDISQNSQLTELDCSNNQLTMLNLANGNNASILTVTATGNSNLTCIQHDTGISPANYAGWLKDPTASWSDNCGYAAVLVSSIAVQGQGGVTIINTPGGTLQMEANVLPANATDGSYTWSVDNQSGAALIDANGLLTPQTDGTVIVRATANDGSGVVGSATIGISNQTAAIENLALENILIYPNPVNDELFIDAGKEKITSVNILSLSGKVLKTLNDKQTESIDLSNFPQGVYFVKVSSEKGTATKKIIKK